MIQIVLFVLLLVGGILGFTTRDFRWFAVPIAISCILLLLLVLPVRHG